MLQPELSRAAEFLRSEPTQAAEFLRSWGFISQGVEILRRGKSRATKYLWPGSSHAAKNFFDTDKLFSRSYFCAINHRTKKRV